MKLICTACKWHGDETQMLTAFSPFDESEIYACPKCKTIDRLEVACDEPDCWLPVTSGTSTLTGYRQTCGKHRP